MCDQQPDRMGPPRESDAPQSQLGHSIAQAVAREEGTPGTRSQKGVVRRLQPAFEGAMLLVYIAVGTLLLATAVATLVYALVSMPANLRDGVPQAISRLLSELLLVLILTELLRTILTYITEHRASIRPFLSVVAISSVRRILSIGADLSLGEYASGEQFNRAMIELVAEGFIILIAAISLYLFSRREAA